MNEKDSRLLLDEFQALKRLFILQLLGQGFKQKQIAAMLGISEATMSRMIPKGLAKVVVKGKNQGSALNGEVDG